MYEILVERRAERELKELPPSIFRGIVARIKALAENPRPPGCKKLAGSSSDWRIRWGNYRVLFEIDDRQKTVRIMRVGHRKEIYR